MKTDIFRRCFGDHDDCRPGAGGLHRRGRPCCTAAGAASRKKPTSRRTRPLSLAATATRQSATAREPPARNGRPPRKRRRHLDTVEELETPGLSRPRHAGSGLSRTTTARNPQAGTARFGMRSTGRTMRAENIGCLFWGGVGTGKSYLAGCIANALMEKEVPRPHDELCGLILNDLAASFEGRNEYISRLCRYPLLIIDDFGMERGTEYGLEQVFSVIDSRYRSGRPLIVTTNLTLAGRCGTRRDTRPRPDL